ARVPANGWYWLAAGILLAGASAFVYVMAAVRRRRAHVAREALPQALRNLAPEFVLYWDAPSGTSFQVAMWLPYLKRLEKPFFVMVRNAQSWRDLDGLLGDIPAVLAPRMTEVDDFVAPTLRAAF